jgi:hypothetical protein
MYPMQFRVVVLSLGRGNPTGMLQLGARGQIPAGYIKDRCFETVGDAGEGLIGDLVWDLLKKLLRMLALRVVEWFNLWGMVIIHIRVPSQIYYFRDPRHLSKTVSNG